MAFKGDQREDYTERRGNCEAGKTGEDGEPD